MPWQGKSSALQAMAAALALAAPTSAFAGDRAGYSVAFAQRAPNAPTALTMHIRYKAPGDPEAKPPPVQHIVLDFPAGTRFADGVRCTASDGDLQLRGRAACPGQSRVGTGAVTVMTGFPPLDPFPTDATLFRGAGELIELLTRQGGEETIAFERLKMDGTRMTADVQQAPGGPPDGKTAARDVDWTIPSGWVVTPPSCPDTGAWVSRGTFTFSDGATVTETSATPCDVPRRAAPPRRRRRAHARRGRRALPGRHRRAVTAT